MSEEQAEYNIEAAEEKQAAEEIKTPEEPNTAEDLARLSGWKPKDEYNGNPADWRSAEVFNERGEWIEKHKKQEAKINDIENRFNSRMDNANKLHQQQIEIQKNDLVRKRNDAIDLADRDQANKFQTDIDNLNTQVVAPEPANSEQAAIDSWNTNNQWIQGTEPKAAYAKQQFSTAFFVKIYILILIMGGDIENESQTVT